MVQLSQADCVATEQNHTTLSSNINSKLNTSLNDRIGSECLTPPGGNTTPHPNLVDNRLPGISHSSFGQVRPSFCYRPKSVLPVVGRQRHYSPFSRPSLSPSRSVSSGNGGSDNVSARSPPLSDKSPHSQDDLRVYSGDGYFDAPPLLPHEHVHPSCNPVTPPTSTSDASSPSASSVNLLPGKPTDIDTSVQQLQAVKSAPSSLIAQGHNQVKSKQDEGQPRASRQGMPGRRHTHAAYAQVSSSALTAPTVATAQLSNPAIAHLTSASRPRSGSQSAEELRKLTYKGRGSGHSFDQNTPPYSPRIRSEEEEEEKKKNLHTATKPTFPSTSTSTPNTSSSLKDSQDGSGPLPPKGKLSVLISEGRNLRANVDPYVVCQFQRSEYISKGPINANAQEANKRRLMGGTPIKKSEGDSGQPVAIPMKSRQSSNTSIGDVRDLRSDESEKGTDPRWEHKATFDVVEEQFQLDVSVYDRSSQESFLGHVRIQPDSKVYETPYEGWFKLQPLEGCDDQEVTGEIRLRIEYQTTDKKRHGPEDFQILKLIGKGTFGQVFQVRKRDTGRICAMKVLSKKVIVQKKEVAHTLGERNILVRTAKTDSPFIVGLKFSFQTPADLYLVTDYMSGGELFWHLQREGRFQEARAKFYIAELILALQHLHQHDIVYRDLKPENILLDANGHIALCDFGLSKANLTKDDKTTTFCGTTEYLAPEVLLDEAGYTKMVDFWSLGVLVFEMCCGWSPFYAEETQQMYKNIAFGKVRFPRDALSTDGRNFVKGLLNRNPRHRLGANGDAEELKKHPFFSDVDWDALSKKNVVPPFKPKLKSELDVSNFDPEFTTALNGSPSSLNARAAALASGLGPASTPLSPTVQANFKGFTFVDESAIEKNVGGGTSGLYRMEEETDDNDDDEGSDSSDSDDYDMSQGNDEEDDKWKHSASKSNSNRKDPNRMSGILAGSEVDDGGIFSHSNFDM